MEVLSDAAGRIFGCIHCESIDPANGDRPGLVLHRERISRRVRRRLARVGHRGRRGATPVQAHREVTRERNDRYVVLPLPLFQGRHLHDLGDGWALGLMALPRWDVLRYFDVPKAADVLGPVAAHVTTVTVTLKRVGGLVWGFADSRAPDSIVLPAFARLYDERVREVFPAFRAWLEARR